MADALQVQIAHIADYHEYPLIRYMGSKYRLLDWISEELANIKYDSVLDAFSGSGAVAYMFKTLGKQVYTNDFLFFPSVLAMATIENNNTVLSDFDISRLLAPCLDAETFILDTYKNIFFEIDDLIFLDNILANIHQLDSEVKKAIAKSCLIRSCAKKQPRGVFTISGNLSNYDDGRRDLKLSIKEHFIEQVSFYNSAVFDNGQENKSFNGDVFDFDTVKFHPDLVYLDPPYIPRSDDNCYIKRYHFLEGLSKYWENEEILYETKVRKIKKKYTPFSYRKEAIFAFDKLFSKFRDSIIVLSYSSNGYPDLDVLLELMSKYKTSIDVKKKKHRYHFGTHSKVQRSVVDEYLIIGI